MELEFHTDGTTVSRRETISPSVCGAKKEVADALRILHPQHICNKFI